MVSAVRWMDFSFGVALVVMDIPFPLDFLARIFRAGGSSALVEGQDSCQSAEREGGCQTSGFAGEKRVVTLRAATSTMTMTQSEMRSAAENVRA